MNDTTRRFLNGVLARVPELRIVEVRLFPPLRQGGAESGVAVLAMEQGFDDIPDATVALELEESLLEVAEGSAPDEHEVAVAAHLADEAWDVEPEETRTVADPLGAVAVDLCIGDDTAMEIERALQVASEGVMTTERPLYPAADATVGDVETDVDVELVLADLGVADDEESIALGDILALPAPERTLPTRDPSARLAILCARYRLVLKGPDRGKWDLEIVHQADAPLSTLDRVISGVVRRSGETAEPERYTAESLRAALDAPPWVEGAAA
jgi:hypothetical protein